MAKKKRSSTPGARKLLIDFQGVILVMFLLPFLLVAHLFVGDGIGGFLENLRRVFKAPHEWE